MTKDDLDLVPTSELFEALARRFECCLFASIEHDNKGIEIVNGTWRGGYTMACGLFDEIRYRLDAYRCSLDLKSREAES
jgi:hypothetical protein